jgi:hypothetical protein
MSVQRMMNWRVREFDFKQQVEQVQLDDYLRGMGVIRHGYAAPSDVSYEKRDRKIEFSHHQHIRPGWPFAIYWPLDEVRFDPLARSVEQLQWVGFRDYWRREDLLKFPKVTVPDDLVETRIAGFEGEDRPSASSDESKEALEVLGRVPIFEIWDRRTHRILYWAPSIDREIGIEDWPLDLEGLPISVHASSQVNEEIDPISEQNIVYELQQALNKLISLVLTYAKKGVPLLVAWVNAFEPTELEKLTDAEVFETIKTKTAVETALKKFDVNVLPQTLLAAISMLQGLIREIQGQGRISHGARENVESGTEAAGIIEAMEVRSQDRRNRLEDFFTKVVRKDWQIFQEAATEDVLLDVFEPGSPPLEIALSINDIKMEYDFEIEVGSTAPESEFRRKQNALQGAAVLESPLAPYFDPSFIARNLAFAFEWDQSEALNPQERVAIEKMLVEYKELRDKLLSAGGRGGEQRGNGSLSAALDSTKAKEPQQPQPGGTPGAVR